MMNRHLLRVVALLLVPCLVVDRCYSLSLSATIIENQNHFLSIINAEQSATYFGEQALTSKFVQAFTLSVKSPWVRRQEAASQRSLRTDTHSARMYGPNVTGLHPRGSSRVSLAILGGFLLVIGIMTRPMEVHALSPSTGYSPQSEKQTGKPKAGNNVTDLARHYLVKSVRERKVQLIVATNDLWVWEAIVHYMESSVPAEEFGKFMNDLYNRALENLSRRGKIHEGVPVTNEIIQQVGDEMLRIVEQISAQSATIEENTSTLGVDQGRGSPSENHHSVSVTPVITTSAEKVHRILNQIEQRRAENKWDFVLGKYVNFDKANGDLLSQIEESDIPALLDALTEAYQGHNQARIRIIRTLIDYIQTIEFPGGTLVSGEDYLGQWEKDHRQLKQDHETYVNQKIDQMLHPPTPIWLYMLMGAAVGGFGLWYIGSKIAEKRRESQNPHWRYSGYSELYILFGIIGWLGAITWLGHMGLIRPIADHVYYLLSGFLQSRNFLPLIGFLGLRQTYHKILLLQKFTSAA